ncbi:bile acid:sodium symporter family protein [Flavobacteriaceae bacterium F08102]|nr:bile acid:sodium symporter family protein [Flavobacteriaceae bacterium F08102]
MYLRISDPYILDNLKINFDTNGLWLLNITLAIIMFGVALGITLDDFKHLFKRPKLLFTGIVSQFVLFPAITFVLIYLINPLPSIALGMIMVAACPGGNISNFMSQMAGGNAALSVSLTAFATLVAVFMTPINFHFWGNLYGPTSEILKEVQLDPWALVKLVSLILGVPLVIGMFVRHHFEQIAATLSKVLKPLSFVIFLIFIVVAFSNNLTIFTTHIHFVFMIVLLHNFAGYIGGFQFARLMGLSTRNRKTLALETGIQNSGLGLLLVFDFFDGLGGMALCVAFWGIWDIVSGLLLASYWSTKTQKIISN